jgi:hypothetical protein
LGGHSFKGGKIYNRPFSSVFLFVKWNLISATPLFISWPLISSELNMLFNIVNITMNFERWRCLIFVS